MGRLHTTTDAKEVAIIDSESLRMSREAPGNARSPAATNSRRNSLKGGGIVAGRLAAAATPALVAAEDGANVKITLQPSTYL